MDWITGIVTLIGVWLTGKKMWFGQAILFVAQIPWMVLLYQNKLWGLLPLEIALIYLYGKNTWNWYKDEHGGKTGLPTLRGGIRK